MKKGTKYIRTVGIELKYDKRRQIQFCAAISIAAHFCHLRCYYLVTIVPYRYSTYGIFIPLFKNVIAAVYIVPRLTSDKLARNGKEEEEFAELRTDGSIRSFKVRKQPLGNLM